MFLNKKLFLIMALCLNSCSTVPMKKELEDKKITLSLPVNAAVSPKIHFIVKTPSNFKFLFQSGNMWEFIPKSQDVNSWTEMITVDAGVGSRITAQQLLEFNKQKFKEGANFKLLKERISKSKSYSTVEFVVAYDYKGRREIALGKYLVGPYDCSGFRYTMALTSGISEEDAIKKIDSYVQEQTGLIELK